MTNVAVVIICSIISVESVFILIGNIFTIYVFWIHRARLKRTSFLLINLAIADLLVGATEPIAIGTGAIHRHFQGNKTDEVLVSNQDDFSAIIPTMFSCSSLFFLVLISLERAYAVVCPLRHRLASNKSYIWCIVTVWIIGGFVGAVLLLDTANMWSHEISQYIICSMIFSALAIICGSYWSIRNKLYSRDVPAINRSSRNNVEQNIKLSKTLCIVTAASCVCWLPGSILYFVNAVCKCYISMGALYATTLFNIASSFVNPVIYSFRMPIFKEPLSKLKPRRTRNNRRSSKAGVKSPNDLSKPVAMLDFNEIPYS